MKDFQRLVPITTYEDYVPLLEQIAAGEPNVLTAAPVRLLEPTSGSTAATKFIPYTDALKAEFQRGLAPWIVHTFLREPALFLGQAYWSVTPVAQRNRRSPAGIPIGFEEESEYLGGIEQYLIRSVMAVPPQVKLICDMQSFRYVTLLFLLRSRSLAVVSVWNPTFLHLLVEPLAAWWPRLVEDIAHGTIRPPVPLDADLQAVLVAQNRPDPRRAEEIRSIVEAEQAAILQDTDVGIVHRQLWPRLRLISCWADANAACYAKQLQGLFPQARIQPKGLLATEGFISLPLDGQPGHALSLRSHFFEFIPAEAQGTGPDHAIGPRLAHELTVGECYAVVITTGGGLYRYQLDDLVEVVGKYNQCPLLRFGGRAAYVSDWFGEKLNERHVRQALDRILAAQRLETAFAMVACDRQLHPPAYVLYVQSNAPASELHGIGTALESELQRNYHYAYCRSLGQLGHLRIYQIGGGALRDYAAACVRQGQRAGDVKPVALHRRDGWTQIFTGQFS